MATRPTPRRRPGLDWSRLTTTGSHHLSHANIGLPRPHRHNPRHLGHRDPPRPPNTGYHWCHHMAPLRPRHLCPRPHRDRDSRHRPTDRSLLRRAQHSRLAPNAWPHGLRDRSGRSQRMVTSRRKAGPPADRIVRDHDHVGAVDDPRNRPQEGTWRSCSTGCVTP